MTDISTADGHEGSSVDSFATPEDMEQRSAGEITTESHPFLQQELEAATRAIRDYCGWHIAPVRSLRHRRVSLEPDVVFLPAMQIVDLTEVRVNGRLLSLDDAEVDPRTGATNILGRVVEIFYVAGYETTPETLKTLTLELAAAGVGAGLGLAREQAGSVVAAYRSATVEASDSARLAPYKLGPIP